MILLEGFHWVFWSTLLHKSILACEGCTHIGPTKVLSTCSQIEVFKVNLLIFFYVGVLSYVPHTLGFLFHFERLFLFTVILLNVPFRLSGVRLLLDVVDGGQCCFDEAHLEFFWLCSFGSFVQQVFSRHIIAGYVKTSPRFKDRVELCNVLIQLCKSVASCLNFEAKWRAVFRRICFWIEARHISEYFY